MANVSDRELVVDDAVVVSVQEDEDDRTILVSWSLQDEAIGSQVLEIVKASYNM